MIFSSKKLYSLIFILAMIAMNNIAIAVTISNKVVAKLFYKKGDVFLVRHEIKSKLKNGQEIVKSDILVVGDKSLAVLSFGDGYASKMKITENSKVLIDENSFKLKDGKQGLLTQVYIKVGSVVVDFANTDKAKRKMKVNSRYASLGVRGTNFFTHVTNNDQLSMAVNHGEVMVDSNVSQLAIPVKGGEGTITNQDNRLIKPRKFSWHEKINWNTDPKHGELNMPNDLFKEIEKQYQQYKNEQEMQFKNYQDTQQRKLDKWKDFNENMKEKMFSN